VAVAPHLDPLPAAAPIGPRRHSSERPRLALLRAKVWPPPETADRRFVTVGCEIVEVRIDRALVERLHAVRPSIVVVDLDGGHFDLLRVCRSVRAVTDAWIIVTSSTPLSDATVVDALDAGADDVVASASTAVVDARVRVGLRVRPAPAAAPAVIGLGDVLIDVRAHELRIADVPVRCPPVPFELFLALARQAGSVVRSEELLRTIWGAAAGEPNPRRLRIAVSAARHILGTAPSRPHLETVTKIGYRLVAPVRA
jgi:two-component system KDP operon response regulator KdpE